MPGEALSAEKKTVQRKIDALKEAAARPGAGRRTLVVLATSSWHRALPGGPSACKTVEPPQAPSSDEPVAVGGTQPPALPGPAPAREVTRGSTTAG